MISPFYTPCDGDNFPMVTIGWAGFWTNNKAMGKEGWLSKMLYNHFTKKWAWRFHHPVKLITFVIKLDSINNLDGKVFDIDNISTGGIRNRRASTKQLISELSEDDVPAMLEAIIELQKPSRKKQIRELELPNADIIPINKANVN